METSQAKTGRGVGGKGDGRSSSPPPTPPCFRSRAVTDLLSHVPTEEQFRQYYEEVRVDFFLIERERRSELTRLFFLC